MTYGFRIPFDTPTVKPDAPRKRKPARRVGSPLSRYTDEQVINAILRHLTGENYDSIAARMGCGTRTVIAWTQGSLRAKCVAEAEKRWHKKLSSTA